MSITRVSKRFQERSSSSSRESQGDSYTESWVVYSDSRDDTARNARLAPGIPRKGDPHPEDANSFVSTVEASLIASDDNDRTWLVVVNYEPPQFGETQEDTEPPQENEDPPPPEDLPRVEFSLVSRTEVLEKDVTGHPLVNSAGNRLVDLPEVERSIVSMIINARVDFDRFDPATDFDTYKDRINSDDNFFGFAQHTAKLVAFRAATEDITVQDTTGNERQKTVWTLSLEWFIDPDGWTLELLDRGLYENANGVTGASSSRSLDVSGAPTIDYTNQSRILDPDGEPIDDPVLLDGRGNKLSDGEPVYLPYFAYNQASMGELLTKLGLPQTLVGYKTETT